MELTDKFFKKEICQGIRMIGNLEKILLKNI